MKFRNLEIQKKKHTKKQIRRQNQRILEKYKRQKIVDEKISEVIDSCILYIIVYIGEGGGAK